MDLLITPVHFFGILAEYSVNLVKDPRVFEVDHNFEGTLHLDVDCPAKPYSLITLQMRNKKIIYNKILEWKLSAHYQVPDKALHMLRSRSVKTPT